MFPEKFSQLLPYIGSHWCMDVPSVLAACDCVVENSLMLVCQHVECAPLSTCVFIVWKPAGHPAFCSSPLMRLLLNFSLKLCWNPVSLPFGKGGSLECSGGWSFPLFIFVEEWSRVTTRMLCYARLEKARGYWPLVTDYLLVTEGRIIEKTVAHKPFSHYLSSAVQEVDWVAIYC